LRRRDRGYFGAPAVALISALSRRASASGLGERRHVPRVALRVGDRRIDRSHTLFPI
jgi:hypothetical protein